MQPLLSVQGLKKTFHITPHGKGGHKALLKAVDDVSFEVNPSQTLGIVGESGCGKSTLGRTILRLYEKTAGHVYFKGQDVHAMDKTRLKTLRRSIQMIFQDPFSALNPRKRIDRLLAQPLRVHRFGSKAEIAARVEELLREVGLDTRYQKRFPHQFSGGQRQRIGIARAIALRPELIICDEAVSALDVSIQAQILNLLLDLQARYALTYIFISHDLSVVEFVADRIMVMYLGRIVEAAPKTEIVAGPLHPYTQSLFAASPKIDPRHSIFQDTLLGDVPSPIDPPPGCHFNPRCPRRLPVCSEVYPTYQETGPHHWVACHLYT